VERHALAQQDTLVRVLFQVERLREHKRLDPDIQVSGRGAIRDWQDKRSSHRGFEAAHSLPCQVLFNGYAPDHLLAGNQPWLLECARWWGNTTLVPGIVNMVDSQTEQRGAKEAFLDSVRDVQHGRSVWKAAESVRAAREEIWQRSVEQMLKNVGLRAEDLVETDTGLVVPKTSVSDIVRDQERIEVALCMRDNQAEVSTVVNSDSFPEASYKQKLDACIANGGGSGSEPRDSISDTSPKREF
jgi:hypothetical protein